jgi:hypothetical protein
MRAIDVANQLLLSDDFHSTTFLKALSATRCSPGGSPCDASVRELAHRGDV